MFFVAVIFVFVCLCIFQYQPEEKELVTETEEMMIVTEEKSWNQYQIEMWELENYEEEEEEEYNEDELEILEELDIRWDLEKLTCEELRNRCTAEGILWRDVRGKNKHLRKAEMIEVLS